MVEIRAALVTATVAIIGAVTTAIVSWLNAKKNRNELDELKKTLDNSDGVYYLHCPNCGAKIYLNGNNIYKEE